MSGRGAAFFDLDRTLMSGSSGAAVRSRRLPGRASSAAAR